MNGANQLGLGRLGKISARDAWRPSAPTTSWFETYL
jgi:hypothetical protein